MTPVVSRMLQLIDSGSAQMDQIGELLSADPALSSRILKVVNSAFYGLPQQVSSIQKAVFMLGLETLRALVLSASVVDVMVQSGGTLQDLRLIWERSLFAAVAGRKIAQLLDSPRQEECFMAALLMDVGMLAQLKLHGDAYARVIREEIALGQDIVLGEVQAFAVSHERLGHCLLQRWGIPDLLARPVLYHHDLNGSEDEGEEIRAICEITHLARQAAGIFYSPQKGAAIRDYKLEAARLISMDAGEVDHFFRAICDDVKDVARQYGMSLHGMKSYAEILDEANQELTQLNKTYEQLNRELLAAQKKAELLAHDLKQANEKLQRLASVDELTGLFNRRYFEEFFKREFDRCRRYQRPMTCIMLDIDHFKKVNDTYGHLQGDSILRELGARLLGLLRGTDVAVRYGGEEFVVLLPETGLYAARIAAEKIRRAIGTDPFRYKPLQGLPITISLGVAAIEGTRGAETPQELLKQADVNLYKAKEGGRNRCCF